MSGFHVDSCLKLSNFCFFSSEGHFPPAEEAAGAAAGRMSALVLEDKMNFTTLSSCICQHYLLRFLLWPSSKSCFLLQSCSVASFYHNHINLLDYLFFPLLLPLYTKSQQRPPNFPGVSLLVEFLQGTKGAPRAVQRPGPSRVY